MNISNKPQISNVGSLEIVKYDFELIKGEPKIIISMVKVLDENGKYLKFAKLREVEPFLSRYPVTFKEKTLGEK